MGFQTQIFIEPASAVAGDFASSNPRATLLAGPGSLTAGSTGVTVGCFAWVDFATGEVANSGAGKPSGFVHREQQAVMTVWLQEASQIVPQGLGVTLHVSGDFWVESKTASSAGQKVFANNSDGTVSTGSPGATIAGHTETDWFVASSASANELIKISSVFVG